LEFIENSHGVILFTFGSTIAVSSIPEHIQIIIKETLAHLSMRVLMKYEGKMEDKPNNVMTSEWFPQRDILSESLILFINRTKYILNNKLTFI